jgi:hypothetical protein
MILLFKGHTEIEKSFKDEKDDQRGRWEESHSNVILWVFRIDGVQKRGNG